MEELKTGCVERCPGCAHRRLTMQQSLDQKEAWLRKQLGAWSGVFESIRSVHESMRWGYRKKILLTASLQNSRWDFGMIRRDEFIGIPDCPVHAATTTELIRLLISILPPFQEFPLAYLYQSDTLATLVLKTKKHPGDAWLDEASKSKLHAAGLRGLSLHLNPSAGRRMFAKGGWHLLWGVDRAVNEDGLWFGRTSFSQLIHSLHRQSLDEAEAFLDPAPGDCVTDLYCGIGSSLVRWIRRGAHAMGIETGGEAVDCARLNTPAALVLRGTCEQRLPQLTEWIEYHHAPGKQKLLYTNPPRTGIEPRVLEWIIAYLQPERLAYLSCSAGTLRRDMDKLVSGGYGVKHIIPFDFFPQTHHVECLVLMERS